MADWTKAVEEVCSPLMSGRNLYFNLRLLTTTDGAGDISVIHEPVILILPCMVGISNSYLQ